MARVTVEDCLSQINNRFELVLAAAKRARQISKEGKEPLVPEDNDKSTVIALREIADKHFGLNLLKPQKVPTAKDQFIKQNTALAQQTQAATPKEQPVSQMQQSAEQLPEATQKTQEEQE